MAANILRDSRGQIWAYVHSRVRDPDEAEEVIQAALVIAWEKLGQLRDVERLTPWFLRICASVASRRQTDGHSREDSAELSALADDEPISESDAVDDLLTFDRRIWAIIRLPRQHAAQRLANVGR